MASTTTVTVDSDFPGGNVVVEEIDGDRITVHQDLRDTVGTWFYWYFRVRGAAGRALEVRFTGSPAIGVRGPAVSLDRGSTWTWAGAADAVEDQLFDYTVSAGVEEVRFSFGVPYVEAELSEFLDHHRGNPNLEVGKLCTSEQGRAVELLRLGRIRGSADHRVVITCRHHACEAVASYELEGMMESILAEDSAGRWLREHVEFVVVPFVDKDGVENGDQGKNRTPHDHNRDYAEGRYASVRAIRDLIRDPDASVPDVVLDLHCPGGRGEWNEHIYFVGTPNLVNWQRVSALSNVLERERRGPLEYRASANLAHGVAWNTDARYRANDGSGRGLMSFGTFLDGVAPDCTHAGLEFPYANVGNQEVNPDTARTFGQDLAHAIWRFLAERKQFQKGEPQ